MQYLAVQMVRKFSYFTQALLLLYAHWLLSPCKSKIAEHFPIYSNILDIQPPYLPFISTSLQKALFPINCLKNS